LRARDGQVAAAARACRATTSATMFTPPIPRTRASAQTKAPTAHGGYAETRDRPTAATTTPAPWRGAARHKSRPRHKTRRNPGDGRAAHSKCKCVLEFRAVKNAEGSVVVGVVIVWHRGSCICCRLRLALTNSDFGVRVSRAFVNGKTRALEFERGSRVGRRAGQEQLDRVLRTTTRRPSRRCGSSPRATSSHACAREIPSIRPAPQPSTRAAPSLAALLVRRHDNLHGLAVGRAYSRLWGISAWTRPRRDKKVELSCSARRRV